MRVIEDWKQALDNNKYMAAILMDLSKAFDCLTHDLLLLKLETYGLSENALKLIKSYLSNRRQCVKLGNIKSEFPPVWEIAIHLAVACDVYDGVFLCYLFSHEVSWMRS